MTLFLVLLFSPLVAAFIYERWVKARAGSISGVFRRLAEWHRMSVAEKAARKELEDKMERQRQEEIRAKREAEENRRQNARAVQELVHPETGTGLGEATYDRERMSSRVPPTEFPEPTPHSMIIRIQSRDGETSLFYECTVCRTREDLPPEERQRIMEMKVGAAPITEATLTKDIHP